MGRTVPATKLTEWKGLDRITDVVHEMGCIGPDPKTWQLLEKERPENWGISMPVRLDDLHLL
jgi:hypothetical protein